MTSCVNKIFERMINDRLVWMSKHKDWFDKNQNGFRKSRLRIDNLVDLVSKIDISTQDNLNTIAVFLDVSYDSAYDNVISNILVEKLQKLGCPLKIARYVQE